MKVAILADTHIRKGRTLSPIVWEMLVDVDYILHAGDIVAEGVLDELKIMAPLTAVRGNGDWLFDDLNDKAIVKFGTLRVGLTHGHLGKGNNTPERAFRTFKDEQVDLIVFGHSHMPYKHYHNGVLLFNPGSTTEKRGQAQYSMGIMVIEDGYFDVQHVFF